VLVAGPEDIAGRYGLPRGGRRPPGLRKCGCFLIGEMPKLRGAWAGCLFNSIDSVELEPELVPVSNSKRTRSLYSSPWRLSIPQLLCCFTREKDLQFCSICLYVAVGLFSRSTSRRNKAQMAFDYLTTTLNTSKDICSEY
jgi:hypothetical protein